MSSLPDTGSPNSGGSDAAAPSTGVLDPPDAATETPDCAGFALSLDGTSYASIPRPVEDDFTLEAWIQTTTSRMGNSAFFSRPVFEADIEGSGDNDDFAAGVLNDRLVFGVGGPDTTVEGITTVTTNEWVHVAVTRQAQTGQLRLIVDGAFDGGAVAANRNALSAPMTISFGGTTLARRFVGLIDEVRIWNMVRSVDEIASTMRSRLSGSEAGLVGYYTFDDLGPNETADRSPTAQPATLVGATYAPSSALCPPTLSP